MPELDLAMRTDDVYQDTTLELEAKFTDSAGAAVDPTTVTLEITDSGQTMISKSGGDLDNSAVGTWRYRHKFVFAGRTRYNWLGETPASSSSERIRGAVQVSPLS